jgi:hypothetical protein
VLVVSLELGVVMAVIAFLGRRGRDLVVSDLLDLLLNSAMALVEVVIASFALAAFTTWRTWERMSASMTIAVAVVVARFDQFLAFACMLSLVDLVWI